MINDRPGERPEERGDEIAFVLDCSPEACGAVFPVEGNHDDEEPEESEQA